MAYTNVWNEAFPADTQAANQFGADLRALELNVRERLGTYLSGPLANQPTPEAAWAGLLYFATDTGQVFQWNGSAWNVVNFGGSRIIKNLTAVVVAGSSGNGQLTAVPANFVSVGNLVRITAYLRQVAGGSSSNTMNMLIGSSYAGMNPSLGPGSGWMSAAGDFIKMSVDVFVRNTTSNIGTVTANGSWFGVASYGNPGGSITVTGNLTSAFSVQNVITLGSGGTVSNECTTIEVL
jgi:hypothetical protein